MVARGRRSQHDPVSVVIADFQNNTKDPAFDGTLEPMLKRALEGASFITAFDRDGIRRQVGAQLPEQLDEAAARGIAVKQGLGVVLAGSISSGRQRAIRVSVNATQAVTGEVITSNQARAASKDQVLDVATRLMTRVRSALGDEASSSAQLFAMASLSATSLDVVAHWVAGRDAASRNNYDEALQALFESRGARSEVRPRLRGPGQCVGQPDQSGGRREIHQGSAPSCRAA